MPVESNWAGVIDDLEAVSEEIVSELESAIEEKAEETVGMIRDEWPEGATGESAAGWNWEATGELSFSISNDVEYAPYVHGGDAMDSAVAIFEEELGDSFASELETLTADLLEAV